MKHLRACLVGIGRSRNGGPGTTAAGSGLRLTSGSPPARHRYRRIGSGHAQRRANLSRGPRRLFGLRQLVLSRAESRGTRRFGRSVEGWLSVWHGSRCRISSMAHKIRRHVAWPIRSPRSSIRSAHSPACRAALGPCSRKKMTAISLTSRSKIALQFVYLMAVRRRWRTPIPRSADNDP